MGGKKALNVTLLLTPFASLHLLCYLYAGSSTETGGACSLMYTVDISKSSEEGSARFPQSITVFKYVRKINHLVRLKKFLPQLRLKSCWPHVIPHVTWIVSLLIIHNAGMGSNSNSTTLRATPKGNQNHLYQPAQASLGKLSQHLSFYASFAELALGTQCSWTWSVLRMHEANSSIGLISKEEETEPGEEQWVRKLEFHPGGLTLESVLG